MTGDAMAAPAADPRAEMPSASAGSTRWATGRLWLRAALVAGWVVLLVVAVLVGERPSSLDRLEADVATGAVHAVTVAGGLTPGSTGFSTVRAHWRRGWFRYTAEVVQARPRRQARDSLSAGSGTPVISRDLGARLTAAQPGLRVDRTYLDHSEPSRAFFDWYLPNWLGLAFGALGLAALLLLVGGRVPWRATRWAWFWLMAFVPAVGVLAFLLLGGPVPGMPPPRRPRGLTGGWAFLLGWIGSNLVI